MHHILRYLTKVISQILHFISYNKNGFKIIENHVQGPIRHCIHVNDLQYVATQNQNGSIKVQTIEVYHSLQQIQHVKYNRIITSIENPLSNQQRSMKEVNNRNHYFGMNQKCHNGVQILCIEPQFWRKIIVFQQLRYLNEECQIMDHTQSEEDMRKDSRMK